MTAEPVRWRVQIPNLTFVVVARSGGEAAFDRLMDVVSKRLDRLGIDVEMGGFRITRDGSVLDGDTERNAS